MGDDEVTASVVRRVEPGDTALALGSGDLEILGTPRLLAWSEQATVAALAGSLGPAETSVGSRVELVHERASPVGADVRVTARQVHVDWRLRRFDVVAEQLDDGGDVGVVIGHAQVTRVVVDRARFLARL